MEKTVLFVEDQIEFRAIHRAYLERRGYRVLVADDGEKALHCAREERPDLILMDFSMPRLDGIRATAELKRDPGTRDIPVVLLTAHSYGSVGRRAREAGCDGYIGKPCDPSRLLAEVELRLGSPGLERA